MSHIILSIKSFRSAAFRWVCGLFLIGAIGIAHAQNMSKMALLVPDGLSLSAAQVTAWTDAAREQGYQLGILRNADFLQQGIGIRSQYSGIIIPDQTQVSMSDALVATISNYVTQGGNIMLVYDAGALTATGFYAIPKSRFSSLVGVDYVLYDQLRERTVGLGPVFGSVSTLRALQIPPGKSMLYTPAVGSVVAGAVSTDARLVRVADRNADGTTPSATAEFLPTSPENPGGLAAHDHSIYFKPSAPSPNATKGARQPRDKALKREGKSLKHDNAIESEPVPNVTPGSRRSGPHAFHVVSPSSIPLATPRAYKVQATTEPLHNISGYVYGPLTYPSFVTQGVAQGAILLSSPVHGLVASIRTVGSGSVLFVNMPLTYLKLSEDAMPLHGFLHQFARGLLKQPRLAATPNGVGGLVFNWHLDSQEALLPMQQLKNIGVWNNGPFSMHMTAGPDTIVFGDRLGFNLPNNNPAKRFLREFDAQGHQVGSHGGWIHDYYGLNASETNQATFQNYLVLNRNAIQTVIGHPMKEYSAPVGNNPLWALTWLEQNGFSSYYSLSHTGTAATRTYRQGQLRNPSLWAFPVTPLGVAATFEEFDELALTDQEISQWYSDLIDFSIKNATSRLIYAHPPGAVIYPTALNNLLQYAKLKQQAGQFNWYTMAQLATFMTNRSNVTWTSALNTNGKMRVTASHPSSLSTMTWAYPKTLYSQPVAVSGSMTVIDQGQDWLVRIIGGTSAVFEASPL
jgi:Polysaccharide deacetylase